MKKTLTFWFEVIGEYSDLCGEEFFVEVNADEENPHATASDIAAENFPNEKLKCHGRVTLEMAEMMGLDTY